MTTPSEGNRFEAGISLIEAFWIVESSPYGNPEKATSYKASLDALKDYPKVKAEWFKNGRESILRKNKSGCCCLFDEEDNIVSLCDAHRELVEKAEAKLEKFRPLIEAWNRVSAGERLAIVNGAGEIELYVEAIPED
jgi:hypothetical protein